MFAPKLVSATVKTVMNDWVLPNQELWAVFPTGRMASTKARAFVEYVKLIVGDEPAITSTAIPADKPLTR
ncbi:transcriptional regulator [Pseudomonas sp. DR 5-09]|nr:transcriptional regulator [Pseudomonas sp. DR 5-09]